jgi:hypothetical protein
MVAQFTMKYPHHLQHPMVHYRAHKSLPFTYNKPEMVESSLIHYYF